MSSSPRGRVHWASRLGFILAAAGSAVGLGNIWKFPYMAGNNGGGLFVLVYIACILLVGIPVFIAELHIGRQAQANVVTAFEKGHRPKSPWRFVGWLALFNPFVILSFYCVVAGWVLDFEWANLAGRSETLEHLLDSPWRQIFWHFVFVGATAAIVLGGIRNGIERWAAILMPALFVLLGVLFVRVLFEPGFLKALAFLFSFHAGALKPAGVLEAVGQSFFTLSLGMGAMITYGSYLKGEESLMRNSVAVAVTDTAVALLAGIVIFAIVFSFGLDPTQGPSLMFKTLPLLFGKMIGGYWIAAVFFLLVAFAALTSSISLLEVLVTACVERRGTGRRKATLVISALIFLLGVPSVLSFNLWAGKTVGGLTFFDVADKITSSIGLPVCGMLVSLFFGWVLGPKAASAAVGRPENHWHTRLLLWTTRLLAPAAILAVLIKSL